MKYKIDVIETWINSYTVEADTPELAEIKLKDGSLDEDYFHHTKGGKPLVYDDFVKVLRVKEIE
jgi:hypothetical protein